MRFFRRRLTLFDILLYLQMATTKTIGVGVPIRRTLELIRLKKGEIYSIYFFAIMYGLLQLSIPLGIQLIINFIQAYTYSTSLWILIGLVITNPLVIIPVLGIKWCGKGREGQEGT